MMSATTLTPEAISYVCTIVRQRSAIELDAAKAYLIEARLSPVARRCGLTSTAELIGKARGGKISTTDRDVAVSFWTEAIRNMPDWQRVQTRHVAACELRRDYIHAHGIAVHAIAKAGAQLLKASPKDWTKRLSKLRQVDWSRSNRALWEGRVLMAGKINKSKNNVVLATNVVVRALGLPLTPEAKAIEELYAPVSSLKLKAAS